MSGRVDVAHDQHGLFGTPARGLGDWEQASKRKPITPRVTWPVWYRAEGIIAKEAKMEMGK